MLFVEGAGLTVQKFALARRDACEIRSRESHDHTVTQTEAV